MIVPIRLLLIVSVFQTTVLGDLSPIKDIEACMQFCSTSENKGNFKDGQCVCENVNNEENVSREQRQAQNVDPTLYSTDLTEEERTARCAGGGLRKHLRYHDADRVAQYFVNGGPSSGTSYFIGAANQDGSNNEMPDEQSLPQTEENYPQSNYGDAMIGAPYNPYSQSVYYLPHQVPVAPNAMNPYEHVIHSPYGSILGTPNYMLNHLLNSVPTTPRDRLLGARLTQRPRLNALKRLSNTLLGMVRQPVNEGLVGARSFLQDLITPYSPAHPSHYANDISAIGRSSVGSAINQANSFLGSTGDNAETPTVEPETASQESIPELSDTKESATGLAPSIPRAYVPTQNLQSVPYNQQYFMPMYHPHQNLVGSYLNTMPRAYILQPVNIMPDATNPASKSELTGSLKLQNLSSCENNNSSSTDKPTTTSNNKNKSVVSKETPADQSKKVTTDITGPSTTK